MSGTQDLRSEHRAVSRMLDVMDKVGRSARRGEAQDPAELAEIVEFLRVFVDTCHHAKEEQLLFPALRSTRAPGVVDVLDGLLGDHTHGRETVSMIASLSPTMDAPDASTRAAFADAVEAYTRLLRAHIVREERDCFDLADRELAEAVQAQLNDGYERIEVEVVGGGVHERFHALLDRLTQKYGADSHDRTLEIELLVIDLEVCARCVPTGEQLRRAVELVTPAAEAQGVTITYRETIVTTPEEATAHALLSSPTIRINGHDIQQDIRESECESCGDLTDGSATVDCREWHYHGRVYTAAPLPMLLESLMDALERIDELPHVTPTPLETLPANLVTYFETKKVTGRAGCC